MRKIVKKRDEKIQAAGMLNISVILMTAAFMLGTYSSIADAGNALSGSCEFFCRLNNVMTGNAISISESEGSADLLSLLWIVFSTIAVIVLINIVARRNYYRIR